MTEGLSEGLVCGADLSFSQSALVWLNQDYTVAQQWTKSFPQGPMRLRRVFLSYLREIRTLKPMLVVIEDNAYSSPNKVVTIKLSSLNTCLKVACELLGVEWLEISPTMAKKFMTGKGTAEKSQVAQELKAKYGIEFANNSGHDKSDAATLACWGIEHRLRGVK